MCRRMMLPGLILSLLLAGAAFTALANGDTPAVAGGDEPAARSITLSGIVEFDQTRLVRVASRFKGRIDKLHVKSTGQIVNKGEPLAELASPDLVVAAQNLRGARRSGNQALEQIARNRLALWGVSKDDAEEIVKSTKAVGRVTVRAPVSGHVIKMYRMEGDYVEEGAPLYDVADLSMVWIEASVTDQADVPLLDREVAVRVTAKAVPKREFRGEVLGLFQDAETRMLKVRFAIRNPREELRPGMVATVVLGARAGSKRKPDAKLKELLKERLDTLRELVKVTEAGYRTGKVSFDRLHEARRALLRVELEMCDSDKARIAVLEKTVVLAKEFEKTARARFETGNATQSDVLLGRAARLEAEIALERAKSKAAAQTGRRGGRDAAVKAAGCCAALAKKAKARGCCCCGR